MAQAQMIKKETEEEKSDLKDNQPRNPEMKGPSGGIQATAKSLLNFVNQTFASIRALFASVEKKSELLSRVWDTFYYFHYHWGAFLKLTS